MRESSRPAGAKRQVPGALPLVLALAAAVWTWAPADAGAAEPCYQDATGRIYKRRRPGFVEVPCPEPGAARNRQPAPSAPPGNPDAPPPAIGEAVPTPPALPGPPGATPTPAAPIAAPTTGGTAEMPPARPGSRIPLPTLDDYVPAVPVPDRWRIVESLGYEERWYDPYNRNVLKADRPVHGDWFFNLGLISDTLLELRQVPTPVGGATTQNAGALDTFGGPRQGVLLQTVAAELVYYKGDTVFKPPDVEFRFIPVLNYNGALLEERGALRADPRQGRSRQQVFVGIQAAFIDLHLRNASDRYDFDSLRVGIQPFSTDFRGFLFQDNQLGVRLFGNRANNRIQYNLAVFRRLEKDTNSGLNDVLVRPREDDVAIANLYIQDLPAWGFTSQLTAVYNRNRERGEVYYDKNGFIQRPASFGIEASREYDVFYFGYNGDGHFGRLNLTGSFYYALGREKGSTFVAGDTDIRALFGALEASIDFDWIRWRLSGLYGSGDADPYDDRATGFDAIFENPQFAGADSSYWIRQAVPLVGGGRVALSGRNGVLASLRPSKDEGQSNFTNPGIILGGLGFDFDFTPTLRLSGNANALFFDKTAVIEVARNQAPVSKHIGTDLSAALTWRPLMSQNLVFRASYATLIGGKGWRALFPEKFSQYVLLNAILAY